MGLKAFDIVRSHKPVCDIRVFERGAGELERLGARVLARVESPRRVLVAADLAASEEAARALGGEGRPLAMHVAHYPLLYNGTRVALFGEPVLRGLVVKVRERLGESVGAALLYHVGLACGAAVAEEYERLYAPEAPEEYFLLLALRGAALSWFAAEEVKLGGRRAELSLSDNWECSLLKPAERPQSNFVRGVLAGFASKVFGEPVAAREVECVAAGARRCRFIIEAGGA